MKTYIGVDLGGTNVRVARVDADGNVLEVLKDATEAQKGPKQILDKIEHMIRSLQDHEKCEGIGLGIPGPIDTKAGKIIVSNNLPDLVGYPIADHFKEIFHKPVFMDNDVNVAGLGEAIQGAGKGVEFVYYLTVSTGVGGAPVFQGKVIAGAHGHAGEVGNLILNPNRTARNGLNPGAVENEMSGPALMRKAKEVLGVEIAHAGELFDLAKNGNEQAALLCDRFVEDFSQLLSSIALTCNPDLFVLGGGVMQSSDAFLKQVEARFQEKVFPGMRGTRFVKAALAEPGLVGAAMLPMAQLR